MKNVPPKYMLISGMTSEVVGRKSATRSMNMDKARRLVITNPILSPQSEGSQNESPVKAANSLKKC